MRLAPGGIRVRGTGELRAVDIVTRRALENAGYLVFSTHSGSDAVEMALKNNLDIDIERNLDAPGPPNNPGGSVQHVINACNRLKDHYGSAFMLTPRPT